MTACVLDASAVFAFYYGEKGGEVLAPLLGSALISSVNFSEVEAKLIDLELAYDQELSAALFKEIVPFDLPQAKGAAGLIKLTRPFGLSFGDRACLALALSKGLPVYTADRIWSKLNLPIKIHLLR